jgi:hypothetical protein
MWDLQNVLVGTDERPRCLEFLCSSFRGHFEESAKGKHELTLRRGDLRVCRAG